MIEKNEMPQDSLVSVIIPAYNAEAVISRSLDSVLKQKHKDIEIIIVDDGSEDDTSKICAEYTNRYSNIKYISQENAGVSIARNTGIYASSGRYITFLDADDELMPDFVSFSLNLMRETGSDVVCTNAFYVDADRVIKKMAPIDPRSALLMRKKEKEELICQLYSTHSCFPYYGDYLRASWGKMYSAALLKEKNIRFPSKVPIGEDAIFVLQAFFYARRIIIRNEYLYKYYRSNQSVTGKADDHFYEKRVIEYHALKSTLNKINYDFDNIDVVFWHRANFENVSNALKSNKTVLETIDLIRDFLMKPYSKKYLAIPLQGKKDIARALLINTHQYRLLAIIEYFSKKDKFRN